MKKDAFYFPHDNNATQDPKLMSLITKSGLSSLGLYWIIIEIMHQQEDGTLSLEDFEMFTDLYAKYGSIKIEEIRVLFFKLGLFIFEDGVIYSDRVLSNKKFRKQKSDIAKKSAKARWGNANAKRPKKTRTAIKEIKKVKKTNNKIKYGSHVELLPGKYDELCKDYSLDIINGIIEDINNYCTMHGKTYQSYAGAINTFLKKDGKTKKFDFSKYDDDELAKILKDRPELHAQAKEERPTALQISKFL